jgi:hypothetical protein
MKPRRVIYNEEISNGGEKMFELIIETLFGLAIIYTFISSGNAILASAGLATLGILGFNGYRLLK